MATIRDDLDQLRNNSWQYLDCPSLGLQFRLLTPALVSENLAEYAANASAVLASTDAQLQNLYLGNLVDECKRFCAVVPDGLQKLISALQEQQTKNV